LTKGILKELADNGFIKFLCKCPKKGYCGALCERSYQRSAIKVHVQVHVQVSVTV